MLSQSIPCKVTASFNKLSKVKMGTDNPYVVWLKCKQKSGHLDKARQNNNQGVRL